MELDERSSKMARRMVVVTTGEGRRGVFFGELVEADIAAGTCVLRSAQMAVYWSSETHGVVGLAAHGPQHGSRITPQAPLLELNGVTSIVNASAVAEEAWRAEPWE